MATASSSQILGTAVVEFCQKGDYVDADLSSKIQEQELAAAYRLISTVKSDAENEIRTISKGVAPHVDTWIRHAGSLSADIQKSKSLGSAIASNAEGGDRLRKKVQDANIHAEFLRKEINYNEILRKTMQRIESVKNDIDAAEQMALQHETMKAIKLLSEALDMIRSLQNYHRIRAFVLLEERALGVKAYLLKDFDVLWNSLVRVDAERRSIRIHNEIEGQPMNLKKTILAMRYLDQIDAKIEALKNAFQAVILQPRINLKTGIKIYSLSTQQDVLGLSDDEADRSIEMLFEDLATAIKFLVEHLPDLSSQLSKAILPDLCVQIRETWLNAAIPTRIDDMTPFRKAVGKVLWFVEEMDKLEWSWTGALREWVTDSARLWLVKRRENDLVTVRDQFSQGLGTKRKINRQEDQVVPMGHSNDGANGNDWDEAWSDDEEEAKHDIDHQETAPAHRDRLLQPPENAEEDGEEADAWGWGDDEPEDIQLVDETQAPKAIQSPKKSMNPKTKTITLKWHYLVSSMPESVVSTIKTAIDDGLALTQKDQADNPIAPAAIGLFALPILTLALYRAVSPHYYSSVEGGNMFLYNDALWLGDELGRISKDWNARQDITPRAHGKVKFDAEIVSLEKFGKRAYAREIGIQKTIIKDLLRGEQCFLSDEGINIEDDEAAIDTVVAHVRAISSVWEPILARTNWAQAVGSLLAAIAEKIIVDVLDISGLQADASYNIASLIAKVVALEDLYIPKDDKDSMQLPLTAVEYAPNWFKFQYLSELLQSNLEAVRYLWFEGEVSVFYTPEELIDLIELSFADSARKSEIIKDIKHNRQPRRDLIQ